jgi:peptidoglycan/LPS O-acetylase OafA/YrhL
MMVPWVAIKFLWRQNRSLGFDEFGPLNVVIYLVLSLICAALVWRENERAYHRYLSEQAIAEINRPASTREA